MMLRKSRFVHQIPVGEGRALLIHAVSHLRLVVDKEVSDVIDYFAQPRTVTYDCDGLTAHVPYDRDTIAACIKSLSERGFLTEKGADEELAEFASKLGETHGRDPVELLERYRRELKEGPEAYWSAGTAYGLSDLGGVGKRLDIVLLGDCDIQMESDFLRREGAKRGLDLRVAATFPGDFRFVSEHRHDAVLIGALRSRHTIPTGSHDGQEPAHAAYIAEASHILENLRARTAAPILIDNLPEPTVQPLGLAERGLGGHRTRFRVANVVLAQLAESYPDVHVVDIAAALAAIGSERMLDDGQVGFTHLGSAGWLLQRPESEKAAVHGIFPDTTPLARLVGADPYGREAAVARTHVDVLAVVLGLDRKKCIIVDLDGVLWPGVLAETGSPFAWDPAVSGVFSYIGLYFGLHEALLCLKKRGIVLGCVSKNDEATVRELWKYPDHYPHTRLLTPDDFVTWRVNWNDKVENIRSIAEEIGFALETFLFIDDHPVERDRVRQRLPEVEVWGEDPFSLRRLLLTDPRLQLPRISEEAAARTDLVKAQLGRRQFRVESLSESEYLASLQVCHRVEIVQSDGKLDRISELFQRTTQFNTTGRKFLPAELKAFCEDSQSHVFSLHVSDRFGDHGLVGAAVVERGEIIGLVLSCRVLGLGAERAFLQHIVDVLKADCRMLTGRIHETSRNIPVRNVYRDSGFVLDSHGLWRLDFDPVYGPVLVQAAVG
jgi:FkbH-like protein